jgi:hypothetical protein
LIAAAFLAASLMIGFESSKFDVLVSLFINSLPRGAVMRGAIIVPMATSKMKHVNATILVRVVMIRFRRH